MQSWDLRTVYIPAEPHTKGNVFRGHEIHTGHFWEMDAGKAAYAQAQSLAENGWELVSVVPETMGTYFGAAGVGGIIRGYILFFNRPRRA
jgi:hypothetical protein